jgi:hypothetical protein
MTNSKSQKVFETKNGVVLFFDGTNYSSNNMLAVKAALWEDIANVAVDPFAAMLASSILKDLN